MRWMIIATAALVLGACTLHTTVGVRHRPAPRPTRITWRYYPHAHVYYRVDTRRYYWLDGTTWRISIRRPAGVALGTYRTETLAYDHPRHFHGRFAGPTPTTTTVTTTTTTVYHYHYYPAAQVYYRVDTGIYYWLDGGTWVIARTPPRGIVLGQPVSERLAGDHPRSFHAKIRAKHPRKVVVPAPARAPLGPKVEVKPAPPARGPAKAPAKAPAKEPAKKPPVVIVPVPGKKPGTILILPKRDPDKGPKKDDKDKKDKKGKKGKKK